MGLLLSCGAICQVSQPEFHFSRADEQLLEKANELDVQMVKKGLVYTDPAAQSYLDKIGANLLAGTAVPDRVNFRFHILRDPMINAFALPNGSIYVNTGLIAALENEAQLASALSHEITHVTDRHAYLESRSIRDKNITLEVIAIGAAAAGVRGLSSFGLAAAAAAEVSQVIVAASIYGYSRDRERDADNEGYERLTKANYDGRAMTQAFELLDERLEYEPIEPFWRTHPKLKERIATAKTLALRDNTSGRRETEESDYLQHFAQVIRYNVELDLESRRPRTALERAQRLVKWMPSDTMNTTLLADAWRTLGAETPKPDADELTDAGKKQARNRSLKRTPEEEQSELLALPGGPHTLAANRSQAESFYREAIAAAPQFADPHRGLGMLYQEESNDSAAGTEYRAYLNLAPADAPDRLRIERRLQAVQAQTGAK